MQAHTHILSQACLPDYSQVLASLPSSSGRPRLHQGKPTVSTQAKWAGAGGEHSQQHQAATHMLPGTHRPWTQPPATTSSWAPST